MRKGRKVVKIPIFIPVIIAILISIIVTCVFGKELITNAAKYIATNASITEDGNYEYEVLEDGTIQITSYLGTEAYVTIPETIDGKTVTTIGSGAFYSCTSLRYINIPNGVENIGDWAFEECINLREIQIPESVTTIGSDAFYCCFNLRNINVDKNNTVFMSENGILFNKEKTEIMKYPAGKEDIEYVIPEYITSIGYSVFEFASNLHTIQIPNGVTIIGGYAFNYCTNLTSIKIPESVTEIEYSAFAYCTNLNNIEIPKSEMDIGDYAFEESKIIKAINPENLTTYEIELPNIIKRAMDENDSLYASEGFELIYCELSEDGTKLLVDVEKMNEEKAGLYVNNGILEGLLMEIVPSGTITYSEEEAWWDWYPPCKMDVTAILHLAEGEQVTNNNGENTYTFTKNGEFTFEYTDANGNSKTSKAEIDWLWELSLEGERITEIAPKTTVDEFKSNMLMNASEAEAPEDVELKVYNEEQEEVADTDFVGTGMVICCIMNGEMQEEKYTLVVGGDTNGDGKADFKDLTKINSHRLNKKSLEEQYVLSADVNDDGIVDFKDLVKINKFRLNKITEL